MVEAHHVKGLVDSHFTDSKPLTDEQAQYSFVRELNIHCGLTEMEAPQIHPVLLKNVPFTMTFPRSGPRPAEMPDQLRGIGLTIGDLVLEGFAEINEVPRLDLFPGERVDIMVISADEWSGSEAHYAGWREALFTVQRANDQPFPPIRAFIPEHQFKKGLTSDSYNIP